MEGDEVQTFGIEPKIWTMTSTTMSLAEKKSKFREMELKHEVTLSHLKLHFIRGNKYHCTTVTYLGSRKSPYEITNRVEAFGVKSEIHFQHFPS